MTNSSLKNSIFIFLSERGGRNETNTILRFHSFSTTILRFAVRFVFLSRVVSSSLQCDVVSSSSHCSVVFGVKEEKKTKQNHPTMLRIHI